MLGRSQSKADKTLASLRQNASASSTGSVEFVECDLADLKSVRKGAEELARFVGLSIFLASVLGSKKREQWLTELAGSLLS
jgi:hypothetical protein